MIARRAARSLVVLLLASSVARAQDVDIEAEHRRGIEARVAHRDADARDLFRALYLRTREPRALARQSLAEGAMGDWVSAEAHMVEALDAREDPWIQASRAIPGGLEENLALFRAHLASLTLDTDVTDGELWIAGARVASLPLAGPVRVVAGDVLVELRAGDRGVRRTQQRLDAGLTPQRVTLSFGPAPEPPRPPQAVAEPVRAPAPPPPRPAPPSGSWMRPSAVVAFSLSAAGLALGASMVALARGNQSSFEQAGCRRVARGADPACDGLEDEARTTFEPVAQVGFVAGAALLAAGVALWVVSPSSARSSSGAALCAPVWRGLQCAVSF
ncbi:MAG: hypothetical protein R3A48_06065 [Polyangiales bacterium]